MKKFTSIEFCGFINVFYYNFIEMAKPSLVYSIILQISLLSIIYKYNKNIIH